MQTVKVYNFCGIFLFKVKEKCKSALPQCWWLPARNVKPENVNSHKIWTHPPSGLFTWFGRLLSRDMSQVSLPLPKWFCHAPQVFILLLQSFQFGQDLRELTAGPLWMFAVPHQMTANVEEECPPGQQHQGNPTPWTCPGPHGSTTPGQNVSWCACTPTDPAGLLAGCAHALCAPSPQMPQRQRGHRHLCRDGKWQDKERLCIRVYEKR